jgi:DivIVA domain-containing protein
VTPPTFRTTRWRSGYRTDDVDDFLADVLPRLTGRPDPELARRIAEVRFATVAFAAGYDMDDVDTYLDGLVTRASGGARPPT